MLNPRSHANSSSLSLSPRQRLVRRLFTVFPLLVIPVIIYVFMAMLSGSATELSRPAIQGTLDTSLFAIPMISGVGWDLRAGDLLLFFCLLVLSIEIVKSTSSKSGAIINHVASMMLFIFCIVGFVVFRSFATSTFFLISMMTLLDVLVGVLVTIVSARRDFGVGDGFAG